MNKFVKSIFGWVLSLALIGLNFLIEAGLAKSLDQTLLIIVEIILLAVLAWILLKINEWVGQ